MLTFDKETHTYSYEGRVVPSVTQILKSVGIIDDTFYTTDAAERGTYIHAALEAIDRNPNKHVDYNPDIQGYVDAWEKFKRETGAEILDIEKLVFLKIHGYAGTVDRIIRLPSGVCAVLDIKTGAPQRWHSLQTMAYSLLYQNSCLTPRFCVYLSEDGTYKQRQHTQDEDYRIFTYALEIYKWKNKWE